MDNGPFSLTELLLYADQFSSTVHARVKAAVDSADRDESLLKISQFRSLLSDLQASFNDDALDIKDSVVCEKFRCLILLAHWIAFYGRGVIQRADFRKLMMLEAGFTRHLIDQFDHGQLDAESD